MTRREGARDEEGRGHRRAAANGSIKFMGALRWFQTLGWLAPSIRDAWHGSHAPRQLFPPPPSSGTGNVLPSFLVGSLAGVYPRSLSGRRCSCSGNPPSPFPPPSFLELQNSSVSRRH